MSSQNVFNIINNNKEQSSLDIYLTSKWNINTVAIPIKIKLTSPMIFAVTVGTAPDIN